MVSCGPVSHAKAVSWDNGSMHPLIKRYVNVAIDGLVQAVAVAVTVAIAGAIMATGLIVFGHLRGPWMDRVLGVIVGIIFVPLAVYAIKLVGGRRTRRLRLLEIPKGFLDYKWDMENSMVVLTATVLKLGAIMSDVGPMFNKHTTRMLLASSSSASASDQLKVSTSAALSLNRYSARVERIRAKYVDVGDILSSGLRGWSKWIEATRPAKVTFANFPEVLRGFKDGMNESNDTLRVYIGTLEGGKGVSRLLDASALAKSNPRVLSKSDPANLI